MKKKYLTFELVNLSKKKTNRWEVINNVVGGDYIGVIKWYAPWRQYCFEPSNNTVFARGCLEEVTKFIEAEMSKRNPRPIEG